MSQHSRSFLLLILQRLLAGVLVLLAILALTLVGLALAEGATMAKAASEAWATGRDYVLHLLQGDLGRGTAFTSTRNPVEVSSFVGIVLLRSLGLVGLALLASALLGTWLGIRAARIRHSSRSLTILIVSLIGVSAPSFFVALVLQILAIRWTRIMGDRLLPVGGFGWDEHLILPMIVLMARPLAQITRVAFVTVGQTLDMDFVRAARSKGLHPDRVLRDHILRNAAIPILTTIGLSLRFALSSLPVIEFYFGWPGAGFTLLKSIASRDVNSTIALLLCLGTVMILVNLGLEVLYRFVDPRLRDATQQAALANRQTAKEAVVEWWVAIRTFASGLWFDIASVRERVWGEPRGDRKNESERQSRRRGANLPLVIGGLLAAGLVALFLLGPQLAPDSPHTTRGLEYVNNRIVVPPFAPDDRYLWGTDPLGRDVMSLVLAGAQQTLTLAALVVLARMVLGTLLGALAGWTSGSWPDRLVLGVAETLAAFPTLLLAMLLILSMDIRTGLPPFLIGLSLVGWTEIMQFVRGEVMRLRGQPFVESALSVGAHTPRIIARHLTPNLMPALISLGALEMGAVMMLLGELGFIGIFIGGGAFAELDVGLPRYHYSDVPEWASLLSNIRLYARTYPWMAIYPAAAFFVSILCFNLLGEGLSRWAERASASFNRLWSWRTVAIVVGVVLTVGWIRTNSGPLAFYRQQALHFNADRALHTVETLSAPRMAGRALGAEGQHAAATYVAEQFEALGLQQAGDDFAWFQTREREFSRLTETPQLLIHDNGTPLAYRRDFAEFVGRFRPFGHASAPVTFLAAGELSGAGRGFSTQLPRGLRDVDVRDTVVLVLEPLDALRFAQMSYRGLLVVMPDDHAVARRYTLPARDPVMTNFGGRVIGAEAPVLAISEATANRILAPSQNTVAQLRHAAAALEIDQTLSFSTGSSVTMALSGTVHAGVATSNVIGHLPAVEGPGLGGRMIIVMAQYDAAPIAPDGIYPGANDNASGVALLLEVLRTMQETGYRPYKTFLFVAYSGEGTEQGVPAHPPDVRKFLLGKSGFGNNFEIEAVVDLRGVGDGQGDRLAIEAGGSLRLADLFEKAARRMAVKSTRVGTPLDISIVFDETPASQGQHAPQVGVRWEGWAETSRTIDDTLTTVNREKLQQTGRAITLALMTLGRERDY